MRKLNLLIAVALTPMFVYGETNLSERLQKRLNGSALKAGEVGAIVAIKHNGRVEVVWKHNENKLMIPASITKILTAATVLSSWGPSKKLETRLLASAPIENGVLKGDIYLVGGGDPGFVSENMWFLVNEFLRSGVKKVAGNIIVDDSRFDRIRADETRQEERVDRAFDAPVGAMSFNWNSINVFVRPGKKVGDSARVFLDPENSYTQLKGEVKTVAGNKTNVVVERLSVSDKSETETIKVSGKIGVEANEFVAYKNISRPDLWSGHQLQAFFQQRGIAISGGVALGKAPAGAIQLARAESKPVGSMVADMMKFSNNFVAEMLVKNVAANLGQQPATLAAGIEEIRKFLGSIGLEKNSFQLVSPSGFSRQNKFTPQQYLRVLQRVLEDSSIYPEAMSAMAIAGTDGTLKSRMKNTPAEGKVRAKTGLLNGVVGLAGYGATAHGDTAIFAFIYNGRDNHTPSAQATFDGLVSELVQ